jgi:hypothetical protein
MKKRSFGEWVHPEMLVGVSAVVIGICALSVSLYEVNLMRAEQRAAVIPLIEIGRSYFLASGEDQGAGWQLSILAENVGLGPARIMDFRVTVDGAPQLSWRSTMQALLTRDEAVPIILSSINGRIIPANRSIQMFQLKDSQLATEIIGEFDRLEIEACFCSVFDECWTRSMADIDAVPVESCETSALSFEG